MRVQSSPLWHGLKVSSGIGLPMLHEMSIRRHKVSSHSFPPPSLYFCLHKKPVWKLADRYKYVEPIGEIFPTNVFNQEERSSPPHPFPFIEGVDNWLWDKVSYSQLRHRVPYTMFSFNTTSGEQKWPTKLEKRLEISRFKVPCWMFSFEGWRFFLKLGRL